MPEAKIEQASQTIEPTDGGVLVSDLEGNEMLASVGADAGANTETQVDVDADNLEAAATEMAEGEEPSAVENNAEASHAAGSEEPLEAADNIDNPHYRWYVVHTYSGYENRAKQSLEERIRQLGLAEDFGEVLIPTESVVELGKGGQKKTSTRKFFPGYMLVQMDLNDETWHCVKGTPRITGFVGGVSKPPSISAKEVRELTSQIERRTSMAKPTIRFEEGETVRVTDGPFQNFNGTVEGVNPEKAKVRVLVSIFGRSTPVELEFFQVEKA